MQINKILAFENDYKNFGMISRNFRYTTNPDWYYENGKISYNFDIGFLEDNSSKNTVFINFLKDYKVPYIGIPRYCKQEQHYMLTQFSINTPDSYFYSGRYNQDKMMSILNNFDSNESLIVKLTLGARGLGTTIIKKKNIQKYVNNSDNVEGTEMKSISKLNTEPISVEANPENDTTTKDAILSNQIIFQKKVKCVEEFRVFYTFGNEPLVYSRGYNSESFGNASITKKETPLLKTLNIKEFEFFNDFFESLNTPYLSVDIYRNENNKLGIFEFQQEFGHMYINDHNKLISNMESSVMNILEKNKYI